MKWLVYLYPPDWCARYGEEFSALLEARPLTFLDKLDIIRGALDAHFHPQLVGSNYTPPLNRLRFLILSGFCAYITFVVTGLALFGMVDDSPFVPAMKLNLVFRLSWMGLMGGSVLALLAVLVGGLPIAFSVLRQGIRGRRKDLLLLMSVPAFVLALLLLSGLAFIGLTYLLWEIERTPVWVNHLFVIFWGLLFLVGAIVSTLSVCLAVARSEIRLKQFRFALVPAAFAVLAMALMLGCTVSWGIIAAALLPQEFGSFALPWFIFLGGMSGSTILAIGVVLRGLSTSFSAYNG